MPRSNDTSHVEPLTVLDDVQRAALAAAYHAEMGRVLRRRLHLALFLFLLFVGAAVLAERAAYPARARLVTSVYLVQVVTAALALIACRVPRVRDRPGMIAAVVASLFSVTMTSYDAGVGNVLERSAMAQVCLLTGLVVTMPWSWRSQLAVAVTAAVGFATAAPHLVVHDTLTYALLAMLMGAITSVLGVGFLERYRWDAFARAALLREEAEVAAALVKIGETLNAHLAAPDMFARVNRVAATALGCDWSSTVVWDESRCAFGQQTVFGVSPELQAEAAALEYPCGSMPIIELFRPGELVEIADASRQSLVPHALLLRLGVTSALYAPIACDDQILGVLIHGYSGRTGAFSTKQRRIALGISHAVAIAMQNVRLIADLQRASRLKSEFVSTMSHELRTPLNVISGYTELLRDGAFDPLTPAQQDTVARVHRSALELLDLVNATLDLNRLEAGRDVVATGAIAVVELCAELAREIEALVRADVALRWRVAPAAEMIVSDRVKLKTILKNLVGNALKFTPKGVVEVTASLNDDRLVLEVRDTGIGIAADDLPTIFEIFRQADGSDSRRFGGVGLGLHIVQRLVELLEGTIAVASAPGEGSTFTVRVPVSGAGEWRERQHAVA